MVTIRMSRGGSKKKPFYHIDVKDSRTRRDGRYIERLGFFNPMPQGNAEALRLDIERVDYWLGVGAQTSDSVRDLIKRYRKSVKAAVANPEVAVTAAPAATEATPDNTTDTTATNDAGDSGQD